MPESRQPVNVRSSQPLGQAPCGFRGRVDTIEVPVATTGLPAHEIESRLIARRRCSLGFRKIVGSLNKSLLNFTNGGRLLPRFRGDMFSAGHDGLGNPD